MPKHHVFTHSRESLRDAVVFRTKDSFGDILVIDKFPFRSLTFDSFYEQSNIDLRRPNELVHEYTHAMILVLAFIRPKHATILGLGGGCLLRSLNDILPKCKLHAIELRQRVYDVAAEFFGLPSSKNITITISDAEQWLNNAADMSTNIVFADMFNAYSMNPFQMQLNFINQCNRVLSKEGWLVINYHEIIDFNTSFFKLLNSVFSDVFVYKTTTTNNNIIFASKRDTDSLHHFSLAILRLEKKLGNRTINFFNRLIKLTTNDYDAA